MSKRIPLSVVAIIVCIVVVGALTAPSSPPPNARGDPTGTWRASISTMFEPSLIGLLTFSRDGTLTETSTWPELLPGHGAWARVGDGPGLVNFTFWKIAENDLVLPPPAAMLQVTGEARIAEGLLSGLFRIDLLDENGVKVVHGFDTGFVEAELLAVLFCNCKGNLCRGLDCPGGAGLCTTTKDCLNAPDS